MKTWNGFEKGINLGGWLSQWDLTDREHLETFITEQDIQDIRAMGADHVRLPVDYSLIEEEDGTPKEVFEHPQNQRTREFFSKMHIMAQPEYVI